MHWTIKSIDSFGNLGVIWDDLNARGANSPVLAVDFLEPAIAIFGEQSVKLAVYEDGDEISNPQIMALVKRVALGKWSTFQPSQCPLGAWLGAPGANLPENCAKLARKLPPPVFKLSLTQLDPDIQARPEHDTQLSTLDYIQTARLFAATSFDDYWSSRSKNLRHNVKRQRNRLARTGIETRLETVRDGQAVAAAVRDYGLLESAGWKAKEGTAVSAENAQGEFYRQVLARFCRRGMGRIYRFFYNDKLVASDLCVIQNGTLVVLKTTYDETITDSSPALLMRQDYLRELFNDSDVRIIEFYGRVMDWHKRLTDHVRTLYHVNFSAYPRVENLGKSLYSIIKK